MEKYGRFGEGSFVLDPEAGVNALFNDATEWLQYARGVTDLLIDSIEEVEVPDRQRMMLALGAIATLTAMGLQCVARGRRRWSGIGFEDARNSRPVSVHCLIRKCCS